MRNFYFCRSIVKEKFNFKCPTCQLSWKDSATNKRLFQLTSGDLFHFGCNETTYHCDYKSVYPNLAKIYSDHLNKFKFNELKLSYNITVPIHWECDKCHCKFELSIDRLLNRIKRSGHYCSEVILHLKSYWIKILMFLLYLF